jgi:hypothetical protein
LVQQWKREWKGRARELRPEDHSRRERQGAWVLRRREMETGLLCLRNLKT